MGCDRCHSLEQSFIGRPTGGGVPPNQPPRIVSAPVTAGVLNKPYTYAVTDPDNDELTYSINPVPVLSNEHTIAAMSIDPNSGVISGTFRASTGSFVDGVFSGGNPPYAFSYTVTVSDGHGGYAQQPVTVNFGCSSATTWDGNDCTTPAILVEADPNAVSGIDVRQTYAHQFTATHVQGLLLTYSLDLRERPLPAGMSIDPQTGLVTWTPSASTVAAGGGWFPFLVKASDGHGGVAYQDINLPVCDAPLHWDEAQGGCME